MIFSSYIFILVFLPSVLFGTFVLRRFNEEASLFFLSAASLVYYGYWDWQFVWVIALSIFVNFALSLLIDKHRSQPQRMKITLIVGIIFNLCLLSYFKYVNFFIDNINAVMGLELGAWSIVLPLGISFFTFQQIAYLVDVYRDEAHEHNFRHYVLFVTFFPQLIAGPIVHHKEMMPQFVSGRAGHTSLPFLAQGLTVFAIGLAKKVLIADGIAAYATPVFQAAEQGVEIPFLEAWGGACAYTFQIYFDFSGYSDMAIGLGLMFGLRLPINFMSPYKARNIIEFWRQWHITLSRFLRDYLYFPLGGNRLGKGRRYLNLLTVMVLGGLWHGANWTFVIWGGLHGVGLAVNHLWQSITGQHRSNCSSTLGIWSGRLFMFVFLVFTWVFFRADSIDSALNIVSGMIGLHGLVLPETYANYLGGFAQVAQDMGIQFKAGYLFGGIQQIAFLGLLLGMVWLLPNTINWASYEAPTHDGETAEVRVQRHLLKWTPNVFWGLAVSALFITCLIYMSRAGEFLYFQF